jgi:hypothetical protein
MLLLLLLLSSSSSPLLSSPLCRYLQLDTSNKPYFHLQTGTAQHTQTVFPTSNRYSSAHTNRISILKPVQLGTHKPYFHPQTGTAQHTQTVFPPSNRYSSAHTNRFFSRRLACRVLQFSVITITPCSSLALQVTSPALSQPSFYGTRKFIILSRRNIHWSLSSASCIQFTPQTLLL